PRAPSPAWPEHATAPAATAGAVDDDAAEKGDSGGLGLGFLGGEATLALLARQRHRGAHALGDEFHQPLHHPLVGVDAGTGQHLAPVARARPAGDLLRPVAEFLVIG